MWRYVQTLERKAWINQDKINQIEEWGDGCTAVYFDDGRRLELDEDFAELVERWDIVQPLNH